MQQFDSKSSWSRLGSARTWMTTLAVLGIASAGFAAVGGVEKIKNLIRISINGEVQEFTTDANGEGTFVIDTGDGGTATVNVRHADSLDGEGVKGFGNFKWHGAEGGEGTIDVDVTSDGNKSIKVIRRVGEDGEVHIQKFVTEGSDIGDLAGTKCAFKFTREDGEDGNVFIRKIRLDGADLPEGLNWITEDEDNVDGQTVKIIKLKCGGGEERELKFIGMGEDFDGADIQGLLEGHGVTRVEIGEDGVPTIHIDGIEGADQVIDIITTGLEGEDGEAKTMVMIKIEAEVGGAEEPKN